MSRWLGRDRVLRIGYQPSAISYEQVVGVGQGFVDGTSLSLRVYWVRSSTESRRMACGPSTLGSWPGSKKLGGCGGDDAGEGGGFEVGGEWGVFAGGFGWRRVELTHGCGVRRRREVDAR